MNATECIIIVNGRDLAIFGRVSRGVCPKTVGKESQIICHSAGNSTPLALEIAAELSLTGIGFLWHFIDVAPRNDGVGYADHQSAMTSDQSPMSKNANPWSLTDYNLA